MCRFQIALLCAGALWVSPAAIRLAAAAEPATASAPKVGRGTAETGAISEEALTAVKTLTLAPGLKAEVFASEPLLQNIVSFAFDERGRVYVVESHRRRTSVFDIRSFRDWVDADLSFRTVEDRANFLKQHVSQDNASFMSAISRAKIGNFADFNQDGRLDWRDLEVESERVRLLWDSTGDGRADRGRTFAEDFNRLVSGLAAGVVARKGDVWITSIPDLVRLRDPSGDGVMESRTNLLSGFGVHIGYGGHDMHGLKFGPDGRLYWSIADRGTSTNLFAELKKTFPGLTPELLADSGAVFRCHPDGSDFELFAIGLRNPQELAFDQHGNLFTGDNDADGGDEARWTYVVEGGDYGWRYGWQHLPKMGAWHSEKLWHLAPTNTGAYIVPPVAHISDGPAGLTYYPGTGLSEKYRHHFFLADFKGAAVNSGVHAFTLEPNGASFTLTGHHHFVWNVLATDVDFGPDGQLYVSDWVHGWEKPEQGRIYRVFDPEQSESTLVRETRQLRARGMEGRSLGELAALLAHADQRVRLEAQFELAELATTRRGWKWKRVEIRPSRNPALDALVEVARQDANPLARLHAIWGIGQVSRYFPDSQPGLFSLAPLLTDADAEVRAQAAKILGEQKYAPAFRNVLALLKDPNPRVRFFAAMSAGGYESSRAGAPILDMLRANADTDPLLRHAGVMALGRINNSALLRSAGKDSSRSVRLAAVLAMRRLARPEIARFLNDADPGVLLEAARAIHDVPIAAVLPELAALTAQASRLFELADGSNGGTDFRSPILRRVINANFRLGTERAARAVVELANHPDCPASIALEAMEALGDWPQPSSRDRIVGLWRPLPPRDTEAAAKALEPRLAALFGVDSHDLRLAAIDAAGKLKIRTAGRQLHAIAAETTNQADLRAAALRALGAMQDQDLDAAIRTALKDKESLVRKEASRLQAIVSAESAVQQLAATLQSGSVGEQQSALTSLGSIQSAAAEPVLAEWLDRLLAGKVPKELHLDVLSAATQRATPTLQQRLQKFEQTRSQSDPLAAFRETLHGGDAKAGREIFYERAEAACFRCHKLNGEGGEVGPDLTGVGGRQSREFLLESIVDPNRQITPGFENVVIRMKNGEVLVGMLKSETDQTVVLDSPEDGPMTLKKTDIESRQRGLSSMLPELGSLLTKKELRDLVAFLSELK